MTRSREVSSDRLEVIIQKAQSLGVVFKEEDLNIVDYSKCKQEFSEAQLENEE